MRKHLISIGAAIFIGLFLIGALYPIDFWGLHHLRFLDFPQKLTVFMLATAAILIPTKLERGAKVDFSLDSTGSIVQFLPFLGTTIFALIIWQFPVAYDPYGDAVVFEKHLSKISGVDANTWNILFGFSLDAWAGQKTMEAVVSLISNHFQITISEAFKRIDLVCGIAFSFFWIYFLTQRFKSVLLIVSMSVIGLASPFMLNFFGRMEIYPPVLALFTIWAVVMFKYFDSKSWKWLILLPILNVLCLKAHPVALLLLPNTVFLIAAGIRPSLFSKLNWLNVFRLLFIPIILAGAFLYFFVFGDHVDGRSLQQSTMQYDHLFLPLFSPEPPLHNYNLLSLNHIWDFLNVIFLWSPAAIFIVLIGSLFGGFKTIVSKPEVILISVPLILIAGLLFVINPILSLPMDWDLYSIPAPFLLMLSAVVLSTLENKVALRLIPPSLAIAILGSSFLTCHSSKQAISQRLESVAIHVHQSYYEWTMNIIERSHSISGLTPDSIFEKRANLVNVMRPNAIPDVDREFSELLRNQAKYQYLVKNDFDLARKIMNDALAYDTASGNNHITLMEINFLTGDKQQAHFHSLKLVELKHPTEEQALKMAIHCALEADMYQNSLENANLYLQNWKNPVIEEVRSGLVSGQKVSELKFLFRSPS
ncbi:MAG: hypothetical protein ACI9UR_002651 [Bacteroidia bacterium]|jgi:hypothetical protein